MTATGDEAPRIDGSALWGSRDVALWRAARAAYPAAVARRAEAPRRHERGDTPRLPSLDAWYRDELPSLIAGRTPPHATVEELARVVAWKMKRGTFRPRNLQLASSNEPARVAAVTAEGFALADRFAAGEAAAERAAIAKVAELDGVGPATASAVLGAWRPSHLPFFDEDVARAAGLPGDFTVPVYLRYAAALRERAAELAHSSTGSAATGAPFTAQDIGFALWAATTFAASAAPR